MSYYKDSTGSLEVLEENNYYPFGLKHTGYNSLAGNPTYKLGYNGKEYQTETSWIDYGARFYMPDIGRWTTIDPLAEFQRKINPYSYCYNNPVNFYDPTGMIGEDPKKADPNKVYPGPTIQEVTLTGKAKSTVDTILEYGEYAPIPFLGSGLQFYNAAKRGDGWGMALGATFLVVDAFTLGEGGEALRLGEKAAEEVTEIALKDAVKVGAEDEVREGVYEFEYLNKETNEVEHYTGQSKDIDKRITQHTKKGKEPIGPVRRTEVKGGKTAREIKETKILDSKGGAKNINPASGLKNGNKVRPVSKLREAILKSQGKW